MPKIHKVVCLECGGKREPFRPVVRDLAGVVHFACKQCWNKFQYCHQTHAPVHWRNGHRPIVLCTQTNYMWHRMTPDDLAALDRARRGIR